jgi:5'-nucleotidase
LRTRGWAVAGTNLRARLPVVACLAAIACASPVPQPSPAQPAPPESTQRRIFASIVHINDVYEILAAGGWGGPARLATLVKQLKAANPNVITVLAGDLLSPSALGTARVEGQRLDGRQMVAVLNAAGLDYATFGNHEFDLSERPFLERLRESRFRWISANVSGTSGASIAGVDRHAILRIGAGGDTLRLALFGITMDRDAAAHVQITEPLAAGVREARVLRDSADVIVALTHLPFAQDVALALSAPEIDLIAGGHDHENLLLRRGPDLTPIAKADANVRTAWVHDVVWDARLRRSEIRSRLVPLNESVPEDSATLGVATTWVNRAYQAFQEAGFQPAAVVAQTPVPLDGLESSVLRDTTTLTNVIADAFRAEAKTDAALYNAGSIRIDDVMPPGRVTQYDVIRILPFGGPVVEVEMRGTLLRRVLEQGERNRGTGGFLQSANIVRRNGEWILAGEPLDDARTYRLAMSDFLLSGREQGMDWLTRQHAELRVVRDHRDVRFALIDELARRFGR